MGGRCRERVRKCLACASASACSSTKVRARSSTGTRPLTTTAEAGRSLEIARTPVVHLAHSSDNPHADVFLRLSDVDPKGCSTNVSEGFVRLAPVDSSSDVHLELDSVAHRFAAGHRIRIVVAGGSHPRWERNLGTGADPAISIETAPSKRTIDLTRSNVVLPVVS